MSLNSWRLLVSSYGFYGILSVSRRHKGSIFHKSVSSDTYTVHQIWLDDQVQIWLTGLSLLFFSPAFSNLHRNDLDVNSPELVLGHLDKNTLHGGPPMHDQNIINLVDWLIHWLIYWLIVCVHTHMCVLTCTRIGLYTRHLCNGDVILSDKVLAGIVFLTHGCPCVASPFVFLSINVRHFKYNLKIYWRLSLAFFQNYPISLEPFSAHLSLSSEIFLQIMISCVDS